MSETAKKIRDHLRAWLDRQAEATRLIPEVQRAFESADWQYTAATFLGFAAPDHIREALEPSLDRSYRQVRDSLPLLPEYGTHVSSTVATGVTSSVSSVYDAIYATMKLPNYRDTAQQHVSAYQSLQQRHEREARVREMLPKRFPTSAAQYDVACAIQMVARSQPDQAPAAASEIRNLLDRFRGELFELARQHSGENMTWETMVERLVASSKPATERDILLEQEKNRRRLYERLSDLTKRRVASVTDDIAHVWAETLDHLYIMCMGIHDEGAAGNIANEMDREHG